MAWIGAAVGAVGSVVAANQQAKATKVAAESQKEAAQLQTLVARELHQHWKNYYQSCDAQAIQQVCATPEYEPKYLEVAGRARLELLRGFARARDQARRCADVVCVGSLAQQCNFLSATEAIATADAVNYGYRWEENQKFVRDQTRLQNLYQWLGLGRNLLSQSAHASGIATSAATAVGALAGRQANGWLQATGWLLSERGQNAMRGVFGQGSPLGQIGQSVQDAIGGIVRATNAFGTQAPAPVSDGTPSMYGGAGADNPNTGPEGGYASPNASTGEGYYGPGTADLPGGGA